MTSTEGLSDEDAALRDAIRSIDAIGEGASGREQAPPGQRGRAGAADGVPADTGQAGGEPSDDDRDA